jgi:hypothetical protein
MRYQRHQPTERERNDGRQMILVSTRLRLRPNNNCHIWPLLAGEIRSLHPVNIIEFHPVIPAGSGQLCAHGLLLPIGQQRSLTAYFFLVTQARF